MQVKDDKFIGEDGIEAQLNFREVKCVATFREMKRDIDHITVHPYRSDGPETALTDLSALQALVREYSSPTRWAATVPVSSGEWGYASHPTPGSQIPDVVAHGKVVSRLYLTTIAARSPISIYYDWRDGAPELMGLVYQVIVLRATIMHLLP